MSRNKKMNTYLKTGLITLAAAVGGGIVGILAYILFDRAGGSIEGSIEMIVVQIQRVMLPVLVGVFVVSVVVGEMLHHRFRDIGRNLLEAEEEECDRLDYEEEKIGAWGLIVNILSQVINIIVLSMGYSIRYLESTEDNQFIYACIIFVLCLSYDSFWQIRYVKTIQKAHPEKKGDPASVKFQQQWLESCDEAEREVIYRSSYKTYLMLNKIIPVLLLLTMLSNLFFNTGTLAVIVVALMWLITSVSYTRSCVQLKGAKAAMIK